MNTTPIRTLIIDTLDQGLPGVSKRVGQRLAEASAFCLSCQNHQPGVHLGVHGDSSMSFKLVWEHEISEQILNTWDDYQEATEAGATGIAFLLMLELTDFTVIRRARKGTGFDYWLGNKDAAYPFQEAARLEVSGILAGDDRKIRSRVRKKLKQTQPTDGSLPAFVVVVEFSQPVSHVVKK